MKDATLAQGNQVLNLILQKNTPAQQLQDLIVSGLLPDLLDANVVQVNRDEFRKALGLKALVTSTSHIKIVGSAVLKPMKGKVSLKELKKAGKYDWVNEDITTARFTDEVIGPLDEEVELVFMKSDKNTISEKMLAFAAENNLVRCMPGDILRLGIQHPELQRQAPYVGLHEPVLGSDGDPLVLALWCDDAGRLLCLGLFDDEWDSRCVFVFRRKC